MVWLGSGRPFLPMRESEAQPSGRAANDEDISERFALDVVGRGSDDGEGRLAISCAMERW